MNFFKLFTASVALMSASIATAVPITDVQNYSNNTATEFFVDIDANKYSSPFYRNQNSDWGWVHSGIAGVFSSIKLQVSAFDVDFSSGEFDLIEVFSGSSWVSLGNLAGGNDIWAFTDFDLSSYAWAQSQVNAGLQVRMNIDTSNAGWLVTLGKATLSVDGGNQQCVPTPGIPCTATVSAPGVVGLFGLSGIMLLLRRRIGA